MTRSSMNPAVTLGRLIEILCSESREEVPIVPQENPFHLYNPPPISFADFAQRLGYYMACSPECFVVAAVYARRLHAVNRRLFTSGSSHKLMLSSLLLGIKFSDDLTYPTKHYARCGGVPTEELIQLEAIFLANLQFFLYVTPTQYAESLYLLREIHKRPNEIPAAACSMGDFLTAPSQVEEMMAVDTVATQQQQTTTTTTIAVAAATRHHHTKSIPGTIFPSPHNYQQQQKVKQQPAVHVPQQHQQPTHDYSLRASRSHHRRHFSETAVKVQF